MKCMHEQLAIGVDGCAVASGGVFASWACGDGGSSCLRQPPVCERRALGAALGDAVGRSTRALRALQERAQAVCALGTGGGVGQGVRGFGQGPQKPQPDDRLHHRASSPASGRGPQKRGSENQALGRSRGGLSTKIHLLTDGFGQPLAFRLTPGQAAEQPQALPLLEGRKAEAVIADRGYDTRAIIARVRQMGAQVVIPSRSHWLVQRVHDRTLYKTRNRIERCFSHLKQFRRLATRYCRLQCCFHSTVALACASIHLKQYVDTP